MRGTNHLFLDCGITRIRGCRAVLAPDGLLAVMHWIHDSATPRGPDLSIRPTPEQCVDWAAQAGFSWPDQTVHPLPPWHFGLIFSP